MDPHEQVAYRLFARYAAGMDTRNFALTRETFAATARFELTMRTRELVPPVEGKQQVGDFLENGTRVQDDQRRHVITNIWTDEEDGKRIAYAYLTLFVATDGVPRLKQTGMFRSEIVDEDGEPRFGLMQLDLDGRTTD